MPLTSPGYLRGGVFMVPTSMTVDAIFTSAALVVAQYEALILLVVGVSFGIFAVQYVIRTVKAARR